MKALITGINGFTGGHLAEYLLELGLEVYGLDLPSSEADNRGYSRRISKIYYADVRDPLAICKIIHSVKPDYLFHLAGLITTENLKELLEINVLGTKNVLEAALSLGVKVLIPGSSAEYGAVPENTLPITEETPLYPINNYGISKVTQTLLGYQYYSEYGCQVYTVRPFNIIGPGEPSSLVCSAIAIQVVNVEKKGHKPIIYIGNIETMRDFIDVRDVVRAYWAVVNKGTPGEAYNVCSGTAYSIREVLAYLLEMSAEAKLEIKQDSSRIRAADVPIQVGKNKKIRNCTGWYPKISIKKTLKDLLEYYRRKTESQ